MRYQPAGISTSQNVYVLEEEAPTASVIVQFSIFTIPEVGLYISNHSASFSFHGVSYSTSFMRRAAAAIFTVLVTKTALLPDTSIASYLIVYVPTLVVSTVSHHTITLQLVSKLSLQVAHGSEKLSH